MKKVYFFVNGLHYTITGNWRWDLPVEELFCVSMFVSLQSEEKYAGILQAIIDPDYIQHLTKLFSQSANGGVIKLLKIRIITAQGKAVIIAIDFIETILHHSIFEGFEQKGKELSYRLMLLQKENQFFEKNIFGYKAAETIGNFGIWYINQDTLETYYSDNVYRIYGLKPQSYTARLNGFAEYIHMEDQRIVRDAFQQAFSGRLSLHLEFRIIRLDGVQRWATQYTYWHLDAKGARIMTGVIQDITDRKAEAKDKEYLEESSHLNQKLLLISEETALLGYWRINLVTRQSFFSNHFYRAFGWRNRTAELSFEDIIPFIHHEEQEKLKTGFNQLFEHLQPLNMECRVISADGKFRYVQWRSEIVTLDHAPIVLGVLQDITAFKTLNAQYQKTTSVLKEQIFFSHTSNEIAGMGNWILDLETGSVSCSDNLYTLFGYKFPDSLSREKLLEVVYPEDKTNFRGQLEQLVAYGQESEFEFRITPRGLVKWMKVIFRCLPMENRKIIFGTFRDISNEVRVRNDLTTRAYYAESLGDAINYRIVIVDNQYRVSGWNNKSEKAYGLKKTDILGKNVFEILPALKTFLVTDSLRKALQGEEVYLPRVKGIISNGFMEVSVSPLYNEQNKIVGVLCLLRDITATIKLQNDLNQRLSFIERLLESTVDRIVVLDREMNFLYWNKKAEEHSGLRKTRVLGKNILEVSSMINVPALHEFRKALKGEKVYIPAEKHTGNKVSDETYIIPIMDDQMEVTGLLWIVRDLIQQPGAM